METSAWEANYDNPPPQFTEQERVDWIKKLNGVCLGSDAFFPFRDNIDRAHQSGVEFIGSPAGSAMDEVVIQACNDHNIALAHTNLRLFHH